MADRKAKPGSAAELAELYPAPRVIAVRVKRVSEEDGVRKIEWERAEATVERLSIRECGSVLAVLAPVMRGVASFSELTDLIFDNLDEYYAAIGRAIHWPSERVAMMDGDDCGVVARAIYEENRDFFNRHLAPLVTGVVNQVVATILRGAGPMPSSTSATTADQASPIVSH